MKIEIPIAQLTPEAREAIVDAWTRIIRAELDERAQEQRDAEKVATRSTSTPEVSR
jgi:hypothetical protein